jgi:fructosamine-3-kinase
MPVTEEHSEFFLWVSQKLGEGSLPFTRNRVSGGCIHEAQILSYENGKRYFIKCNDERQFPVLKSESVALKALAQAGTVKVPEVCFVETYENQAVLALEYLELSALRGVSASRLGEQLASLHSVESDRYGFEVDNFIGANPQENPWESDWSSFFAEHRISFQLKLASRSGYSFGSIASVERAIVIALESHQPKKSLLHGDLWGGNAASMPDGTPVIFDPATYYGDAETDMAFTEVFGGFSRDFYEAYQANWNDWDAEGYAERKNIYNLYHYLNHLNLFGSGYYGTCESIIQSILKRYG